MTAATYTLAQAAARVGLSGERLRKVAGRWNRDLGFPAPIKAPPAGRYAWDRAALDGWVAARTGALMTDDPAPAPVPAANDRHPADRPDRGAAAHIAHQRRRIAALMQQGTR